MPKLSPLLSIKEETHETLNKVAVVRVKNIGERSAFSGFSWDDEGNLIDVSFRIGPKTASKLIKELQKLVKKGKIK